MRGGYAEDPKLGILSMFLTVDGECNKWGPGGWSVFVRTRGCTVGCSWCDTKYSWPNKGAASLTYDQVFEAIDKISCGVRKVTITGGEPLEQSWYQLGMLVSKLLRAMYRVSIETAGTQNVIEFGNLFNLRHRSNLCFVVDYKLPSSGFKGKMDMGMFQCLRPDDVIKFVIDSPRDVTDAAVVVQQLRVFNKHTPIYFSPSFGMMSPEELFWAIREQRLHEPRFDVRLNLQQHKYIFPNDIRNEENGGIDYTKRTLGREEHLARTHKPDSELGT